MRGGRDAEREKARRGEGAGETEAAKKYDFIVSHTCLEIGLNDRQGGQGLSCAAACTRVLSRMEQAILIPRPSQSLSKTFK